MAAERIEDEKPTIPLGKCFWKLSGEERRDIEKLFASEDARQLVTALKHRSNDAPVRVMDAAYWVKGCSSLGLLRYAVLIQVDKGKDKQLALMDLKEGAQAAAPRAKKASIPRSNGDRILEGARHLSPFLGKRMMSGQVCGTSVFLRELLPRI